MSDRELVDLFWARSEAALAVTQRKYGKYCNRIAYNILRSDEDAEECVNDAYLRVWNSIPPQKPEKFSAFIGRITRNIALDIYDKQRAAKRGSGKTELVIDELLECVPNASGTAEIAEEIDLREALGRFLRMQTPETRRIFMQRYWYMSSVSEIAVDFAMSEGKIKMILMRARNRLKLFLEEEGIRV